MMLSKGRMLTLVIGLTLLAGVSALGVWGKVEWCWTVSEQLWIRVRIRDGAVGVAIARFVVRPHLAMEERRDLENAFRTDVDPVGGVLLAYVNRPYLYGGRAALARFTQTGIRCHASLVVGLIAVCTLFFGLYQPLKRYRRRRSGLCASCGYDLSGNVSGKCPECGTVITIRTMGRVNSS